MSLPFAPLHAGGYSDDTGGSGSGSGSGSSIPAPPKPAAAAAATVVRVAAGKKWVDDTLQEWPEGDYRIFVGDLDPEIQSETLAACFSKYSSFAMAKVVKENHGPKKGKGKGYGFVSFLDPMECALVLRTEQGKLCGSRPIERGEEEGEGQGQNAKRAGSALSGQWTVDSGRR